MRYSILALLVFTAICAIGVKLLDSSRPPTMADWNYKVPPNGKPYMDEGYAYEHFYGKSRAEALELLRENDEYYVEDFTYMPLPAFNFYYPALVEHVTSVPLDERNVIGYLGLLTHKIEFDSGLLDQHAQLTVDTLKFIEDNGELDGPYRLFETRLQECLQSDWFATNGG